MLLLSKAIKNGVLLNRVKKQGVRKIEDFKESILRQVILTC
jgi:hypothetical protein